jgi:methionine aminotransferase
MPLVLAVHPAFPARNVQEFLAMARKEPGGISSASSGPGSPLHVAAPAELMAEFRKVHQFNVFTVNTPMQAGLASYMADPAPYLQLPAFYQAKRDLFRQGLEGSRLRLLPTAGTYFVCADISAVSDLDEAAFCQWLVREHGVAAIPLSAFYGDGFDQRVVRFCFAKQDSTLRAALERLRKL